MEQQRPSLEYLRTRLSVDVLSGSITWIDATKHHSRLNGKQAGCKRRNHCGKYYWNVKVDSYPLKRSHIVYLFAHGEWPVAQIDHINGDSLDDRIENLREVTVTQNAWNHKGRKKSVNLPMGIRALPSGKFQARIACNHIKITVGSFDALEDAVCAYQTKRKELFGDYA